MHIHKYYGAQSHNPKFIIRNAIEKDALIVCEGILLANAVEEAARGINIHRPFSIRDLVQHYNPRIKDVIFIPDKKDNTEQKYNSDPDFSNAEKGDLIWNDAYGLGKIKGTQCTIKGTDHMAKYTIGVFEYGHLSFDSGGKVYSGSPKPTFFYSDGNGNNYLTKRPKQEIDFSTLKQGTRLKTAGGALVYFVAYMPVSHQPICVAGHKHVDGVYSDTRFLPVSAIVRVEED